MLSSAGEKGNPLISIIMSAHNNEYTVSDAVNSIILQSYENWEFFIFDDCSADNTLAILNSFSDRRIKIIAGHSREGLPKRLNACVKLARGDFIARMDADDISMPNRLERQLFFLNKNPNIDLVSSSILLIDHNKTPIGINHSELSHLAISSRPWFNFPMPHPTWMGKRSWFENNLYQEKALKAQDQILLFDTFKQSNFASIPEVLLAYNASGLSIKKSFLGRFYFLQNLLHSRNKRFILLGFLFHFCAFIRDALAISSLLEKKIIKTRVTKPNKNICAEWQSTLLRLKRINDVKS